MVSCGAGQFAFTLRVKDLRPRSEDGLIQNQRSSASASEVSFERRHVSRRRSRRYSCRGLKRWRA